MPDHRPTVHGQRLDGLLTGSGSACFVEFADRGSAERALAALPPGLRAWLARGADRSPLLEAAERFQ